MTLLGFRRDYKREVQRISAPRPLPPMIAPSDQIERNMAEVVRDQFGRRPTPPSKAISAMVEELERVDRNFYEACQTADELAARHRTLKAEILIRLEADDATLEARRIENERLRGRLGEPAAPAGEEKQAEAALDVKGGDHAHNL